MKSFCTRISLAVLVCAAGLLVCAPAAHATDFALFGSYWDTDALNSSAGGGAKVAFGDGPFKFEVRGTYFPDLNENLDELLDRDDDFEDIDLEAVPLDFGVNYHFDLSPNVDFFIAGGGTYFLLDTDAFEVDDEVGFYVGAGAEFGTGNVAFFVEGLYRSVEGTLEGDDIDPDDLVDRVELDLSGPTANAGVRWRF